MKKMINRQRKGNVAVLIAFLLVPLISLLAFAVDYGFLLYIKSDMQRVADQAALAAVRDLVPNKDGIQDQSLAKATVIEYVNKNFGADFDVNESDIEVGKYDPETIYESVDILSVDSASGGGNGNSGGKGKGKGKGKGNGNGNSGSDERILADTVRVSLRRDSLANTSVSLYFARIFGRDEADVSVTSTAVLQRGRLITPGTQILPIAISQQTWNELEQGDEISIYGDGRITDSFGDTLPGNFGTVNIGPTSNSTSALNDQINNGLSANDLTSLHNQGAIESPTHIDPSVPMTVSADPGLSSGIKHSIADAEGDIKLVPIYQTFSGNGANAKAKIVSWGVVEVGASEFKGSKNTYINVKRVYGYEGLLGANKDLSDSSEAIEGIYTSPALME